MSEQAVIARPRRLRAGAAAPARGSALSALAVAGLLTVALAAVWALAELVPAIHLKDAVGLYEFTTLDSPRVHPSLHFLLHLLDAPLFILWAIALVAVALAGERPRVAIAVAAVLALAPLTAEQLKPLLAHHHDTVNYVTVNAASWPSGHATAATALALCAVLVAPRRLRPLVAVLASAFVLAVSVALLVLAWHMPSDVVGGILLASLWMALAVAGLRASERAFPPREPRPAGG
jgi:membrane-associated phospholipid phosphatase